MPKLECYPMSARPPDIIPGRPQRAWMEAFDDRHPYRCLPLSMANTTGWEIICPVSFTAEWNGGLSQNDITLKPDHPFPGFEDLVKSGVIDPVKVSKSALVNATSVATLLLNTEAMIAEIKEPKKDAKGGPGGHGHGGDEMEGAGDF